MFDDIAKIDTHQDTRSISFENPTGARGAGGTAHGGRKGAPNRFVKPGEDVTLCNIQGPGRITHIWLTVPPMPPEEMRALILEGYYDGDDDPSISVPVLDFFGAPHGRPVPLTTALTSIQEGRGFNSYIPMPFDNAVTLKFRNKSNRTFPLYYQIDYWLGEQPQGAGLLHASFRRENPTVLGEDFTIIDGLQGPGRFLGCVVGVRVLNDVLAQQHFSWYGEGEVKIFRDGDSTHPTICGTGFEDYAGTAWGMGAHQAPWSGVPHEVRDPESQAANPDFASLYRWHGPDAIMFNECLRVTVQQIGAVFIAQGQEHLIDEIEKTNPVAGAGWQRNLPPPASAFGIVERIDDVCATSFTYLTERQSVISIDVAKAIADLARKPYEKPNPLELMMGGVGAFNN